jgi:tRNA nucleotidyltransferase (CCA-adding enzyme)
LVGGAVRDALLQRQRDYLDLDFVLPEAAVEIAKKIANYYHAGFVVLDRQRQIARVVFPQGTVDFARQEGDCLTTDLRRRDFTVNAIAYNPYTAELIDPLGGLADLRCRVLKMVSATNLADDPLRLLRAYRQAAQLDFTIEAETRAAIRKLVPLLAKVAAERVQMELGYLLSHSHGSYWLAEAWKDGLLQPWFPTATTEKIERLATVDRATEFLSEIIRNETGDSTFAVTSKASQTAKLASLVSSEPALAELELMNLKYARSEMRAVVTALKYLPYLHSEAPLMSLREQYFLFLEAGDIFPILALLALASEGDAKGTLRDCKQILSLVRRYYNPNDPVAYPQPLVTGHDLLEHLKIAPGPRIGKLLTEIQIAHLEGKVSSKEEALKFAKFQAEIK